MTIPDWQLPPGVDRGLWDYMNSQSMVAEYDRQMAESALAHTDVEFCKQYFTTPGSLIDLGCGTGRLAKEFPGFDYLGVDLSEEMLIEARRLNPKSTFAVSNLVERETLPKGPFDYATCLFSTLGMIRGEVQREKALQNIHRLMKPGGTFILHVHNRYFRELGIKGWRSGDVTMPQAYGGAPLTLHHFSRSGIVGLLKDTGWLIKTIQPVNTEGPLKRHWLLTGLRAYGYLIAANS
jgi:SAM-dependent methyltransferase